MTEAIQEIASKYDDNVGEVLILVEELTHIQHTIARMAEDADTAELNGKWPLFLWDNNTSLQLTNALLPRIVKELKEQHKQMELLQDKINEQAKMAKVPAA